MFNIFLPNRCRSRRQAHEFFGEYIRRPTIGKLDARQSLRAPASTEQASANCLTAGTGHRRSPHRGPASFVPSRRRRRGTSRVRSARPSGVWTRRLNLGPHRASPALNSRVHDSRALRRRGCKRSTPASARPRGLRQIPVMARWLPCLTRRGIRPRRIRDRHLGDFSLGRRELDLRRGARQGGSGRASFP